MKFDSATEQELYILRRLFLKGTRDLDLSGAEPVHQAMKDELFREMDARFERLVSRVGKAKK